jgi:hypothetical protein
MALGDERKMKKIFQLVAVATLCVGISQQSSAIDFGKALGGALDKAVKEGLPQILDQGKSSVDTKSIPSKAESSSSAEAATSSQSAAEPGCYQANIMSHELTMKAAAPFRSKKIGVTSYCPNSENIKYVGNFELSGLRLGKVDSKGLDTILAESSCDLDQHDPVNSHKVYQALLETAKEVQLKDILKLRNGENAKVNADAELVTALGKFKFIELSCFKKNTETRQHITVNIISDTNSPGNDYISSVIITFPDISVFDKNSSIARFAIEKYGSNFVEKPAGLIWKGPAGEVLVHFKADEGLQIFVGNDVYMALNTEKFLKRIIEMKKSSENTKIEAMKSINATF